MANRPPTKSVPCNMKGTILPEDIAAPSSNQVVVPTPYPYATSQMYHPIMSVMMPGQLQAVQSVYQAMVPTTASIYTASVTPNYSGTQQQQGQERWHEEQQRQREQYTKERNYQIQQQRLREFQSAGSQLLNAEHLIQNMFGRTDDRKTTKTAHHNPSQNHRKTDERLTPIQKARDWSQLGDLRDVFEVTSEELPPWCQDGALVPKLYTEVERYVTRNGTIDTSLLYPVLLSSGLSRETLGHIWTLANRQTLGRLTKSELYAILALVAVAQNACQITSLTILNSFHQAPVPLLNQTTSLVQMGIQESSCQMIVTRNQTTDEEFDDFQSASSVSELDPVMEVNIGSRLANHGLINSTDVTGSQNAMERDDDFSDFQHASEVTSIPEQKPVTTLGATKEIAFLETLVPAKGDPTSNAEDKYSVFRTLGSTNAKETDDFSDFLCGDASRKTNSGFETTSASSTSSSYATDFANSTSSNSQIKSKDLEEESTDDDFEFMSYVSRKPSSDRLDSTSVPSATVFQCVQSDNDDFGDFVAPGEMSGCDSAMVKTSSDAPDVLSLNFSFLKLKDKSSVESQSVSSLDWGTQLDNGPSRCGSIPSLDLKVGSDNDPESRDPSPSCVPQSNLISTNGFGSERTIGTAFDPLVVDRYSVIRSDAPKECEWQRCLDSCYELIQNALNIFNGISSSSVCKEVIGSEEGENYLQNIVEVYRISLRISASSKVAHSQMSKIEEPLREISEEWNNLSSFIIGSQIYPDESCFDFSSSVLDPNRIESLEKACGVCLLEVKDRSPSTDADTTLMYGGRKYHSACANFYVNCVDSLLPALTFPKRQLSSEHSAVEL